MTNNDWAAKQETEEAAVKAVHEQAFKTALMSTAPAAINPETGNTVAYDGMRALLANGPDPLPEKEADYRRARKKARIKTKGEPPDYKRIAGSKVVLKFEIPHCGWEMDDVGWVTEDGRIWETNHGGLCEMSPQELAELDERVDAWARGVHNAREEAKLLRAQRKEERG